MTFVALLTVALVAAVVTLLRRASVRGGLAASRDEELRRRLARKVMGNEAAVTRLIELERSRRPDAREADLIQSAIDRLDRDRR